VEQAKETPSQGVTMNETTATRQMSYDVKVGDGIFFSHCGGFGPKRFGWVENVTPCDAEGTAITVLDGGASYILFLDNSETVEVFA
jgi:hypothetical protein